MGKFGCDRRGKGLYAEGSLLPGEHVGVNGKKPRAGAGMPLRAAGGESRVSAARLKVSWADAEGSVIQ